MDPLKCEHCGKMQRLAYVRGQDVHDLLNNIRFTVTLTRTPRVYVWELDKKTFALLDEKKYLNKVKAYAKAAEALECPVCARQMPAKTLAQV